MTDTTLVQRLLVRWEATDEPTTRKINRYIRERKEAADEIDHLTAELAEARKVIGDLLADHTPIGLRGIRALNSAVAFLASKGE